MGIGALVAYALSRQGLQVETGCRNRGERRFRRTARRLARTRIRPGSPTEGRGCRRPGRFTRLLVHRPSRTMTVSRSLAALTGGLFRFSIPESPGTDVPGNENAPGTFVPGLSTV